MSRNILLIMSVTDIAQTMATMLHVATGASVNHAMFGEEAVGILSAGSRYDLVIIDFDLFSPGGRQTNDLAAIGDRHDGPIILWHDRSAESVREQIPVPDRTDDADPKATRRRLDRSVPGDGPVESARRRLSDLTTAPWGGFHIQR